MQNGTMIQFFHWYTPADGNFWKHVKEEAPRLAKLGINAVWLPPACKAAGGGYSVGYDIYDLYDLGEFDQKGTIRTRYGTKEEYHRSCARDSKRRDAGHRRYCSQPQRRWR